MATVICPSCGRFNIVEELAARKFACEMCQRTIPIPRIFRKMSLLFRRR
jgi:ribosomal protein S27E